MPENISPLARSLTTRPAAELQQLLYTALTKHHDAVCALIALIIVRSPTSLDVHLTRLVALRRVRDDGESLRLREALLKAQTGPTGAWYSALVRVLCGEGTIDQSQFNNNARRAVEYHYYRGQALFVAGDIQGAYDSFSLGAASTHDCLERTLARAEATYLRDPFPIPELARLTPYRMLQQGKVWSNQGRFNEAYLAASLALDVFQLYGTDQCDVASALFGMADHAFPLADIRHGYDCVLEGIATLSRAVDAKPRFRALGDIVRARYESDFGRKDVARSLIQQSVETLRLHGEDEFDDYGAALNQLAKMDLLLRNPSSALEHATESLRVRGERLGLQTVAAAKARTAMAQALAELDRWPEAEQEARRSFDVHVALAVPPPVPLRLLLAECLLMADKLDDAGRILDEVLEDIKDPATQEIRDLCSGALLMAARLASARGETRAGWLHAVEAERREVVRLAEVLPIADWSTRRRQSLAHRNAFDTASRFLDDVPSEVDAAVAWTQLLRRKSLVLESARSSKASRDQYTPVRQASVFHEISMWRCEALMRLGERRRDRREDAGTLADITGLTGLAELVHHHGQALEEASHHDEYAEGSARSLEAPPAHELLHMIGAVDAGNIRQALPSDAVLVDIVLLPGDGGWGYRAFVATRDRAPRVFWIDGASVAGHVATLRADASAPRAGLSVSAVEHQSLVSLADAVLRPIEQIVGATPRNLLIVPDGDLYYVPWDALPDRQGQPLCLTCSISLLPSACELTRNRSSRAPGPPVIVGAPDFGRPLSSFRALPEGSLEQRLAARTPPLFAALPASETEARAVHELVGGVLLLGEQASKAHARAIMSPSILHLATHAYYLPYLPSPETFPPWMPMPSAWREIRADHPLELLSDKPDPELRMGIALAGANSWFRTGAAATPDDTGILHGNEVAGLDLEATELVMLSACESAIGDPPLLGSEIGLHGRFYLAGAKRVCGALWRVPDSDALMLMRLFYSHLSSGVGPAESLRRTKAELVRAGCRWSTFSAFVMLGRP
jgi:CHAT domain-containing protein